MPDRRARTLLEFAIAASAAVVPVLVAVLLGVALLHRPDPAATAASNADRHVSVRELAALKTFERAVVRRRDVTVGPPPAVLILDRVPSCRAAWDGHEGVLARLRRALGRGGSGRGVAGAALGLAARRSRRGTVALQHRAAAPRERGGGLRLGTLVRRSPDRPAVADRGGRIPGTCVHGAMRRHRQRRGDARRARTGGCLACCPGAAARARARSRAGAPTSSSR